MARRRRSLLFVPFLIAICALLGGFFGPGTQGVSAASSGAEDDVDIQHQSLHQGLLAVVEENFADKVNPDKAIYKGAHPGHAADSRSRTRISSIQRISKRLREDQRGHYLRRRYDGRPAQRQDHRDRAVRRLAGL